MVGVAQLVEHLVVVQVAAGSSPVTHPDVACTLGVQATGRQWVAVSSSAAPMTCRDASERAVTLSGPGGVTNTASR